MKNNGSYFVRLTGANGRLTPRDEKFYPEEVFLAGTPELGLFTHKVGDYWNVTEKETGCRVASAVEMADAQKEAIRAIGEFGGEEKFIDLIAEVLVNLAAGLEYDFEMKEWV